MSEDANDSTTILQDVPRTALSAQGESCLVMIYGPDLGQKFLLDRHEVNIGRDPYNQISVMLHDVSRNHCRIQSRDGSFLLQDLGSTNGTYLNDEPIPAQQEVILRSGDLIRVGGAIYKFLFGGNVETLYHEEIYRTTIIDGLTQIYNRRFFVEFLERELARCSRHDRPLTLVMFDIDYFKKTNDEFGHTAGDYVLRDVARIVQARVRKEQCFARYGGEEFAAVLPDSDLEGARAFAEQVRMLIAEHQFTFDTEVIPVTISVGVADRGDITDPTAFIKVVDDNLYAAKHAGRNCVIG